MTNTFNPAPLNLNWVKLRAECSIGAVFKALELGAREDVEAVKSLLKAQDRIGFSIIVANHRCFSVLREEDASAASPIPISRDVNFVLEGQEIVVSDNKGVRFKATITLNNEGLCKLVVGKDELELWQVRRMALEKLFFGPLS